jgi:hypothetical protein
MTLLASTRSYVIARDKLPPIRVIVRAMPGRVSTPVSPLQTNDESATHTVDSWPVTPKRAAKLVGDSAPAELPKSVTLVAPVAGKLAPLARSLAAS